MADSEMKAKLLQELEEMGFPLAIATQALRHSGNGSFEDAVNWIIDHENELLNDLTPTVAVEINIEDPRPAEITEEMKIKAQELRSLTRPKLVEKDKQPKIESQKAERRVNLVRPREYRVSIEPATLDSRQKSSLPVKLATKELMRDCLRTLKQNYKNDDRRVKMAFQTLLVYVRNVMWDPNEEKFRKIRIGNQAFWDRVGSLKGGVDFLELCGFKRSEGGEFLILPRDKVDAEVLQSAASVLHSAITNPFFGLLQRTTDEYSVDSGRKRR